MQHSREQSVWRERLVLWAGFAVLGAVIGVSAYRYGIQVGKAETSAPAQSAPGPAPQISPETSTPAAPSTATDAIRPATGEITPVPPSTGTAPSGTLINASKTENPPSATGQAEPTEEKVSSAPTDRSDQQAQAGQSELAAAEAYLTGRNGGRDSAKAARLLWAAVGNGNSTAEVLLADLYARGDGVVKNCEQGRILLVAAIKSGNIEAQQKLKELTLGGCKQ